MVLVLLSPLMRVVYQRLSQAPATDTLYYFQSSTPDLADENQ